MKRRTKILIGILILLILIHFIRPERNNGDALGRNDFTHEIPASDTIMGILKVSCFDCHSNHTNYPWYAEISPSSLWLANHIKNGKAELNFSDFSQYTTRRQKNKLNSIAKQVEEREMPLKSYLLLHGNARLSAGQIQLIKDWVDSAKAELERKQ